MAEQDVLFPGMQANGKRPKSQKGEVAQKLAPVEDMVARVTKDPWEQEKLPRIWRYYCERMERSTVYMPTEGRMRLGLARLREAVAAAKGKTGALRMMKLAIDNLAEDEFLSGKNDRHKEYRDWADHLMKNWETFEKRLLAK